MIKVALIQHPCPTEVSPSQNLRVATDMIRDATAQGATLIATQELFTNAYFPQTEDDANFALAEPIPGPTSQQLCELAKKLNITLTASLFERRAAGVYHNTSIMIDPTGTIIDRYRKMHIPDDPRFYEKFYFTPGDLNFRAQQIPPQSPPTGNFPPRTSLTPSPPTTGMLICWDQWFPEAARLTAMRGAQIIFYPTAIAYQPEQSPAENETMRDAWQTIQRSHAIANGIFICAINRIGVEHNLTFWGGSFIADPMGQIIAQATDDQPAILVAELDLSLIEKNRQAWPFLRDRRIDAYEGLTKRLLDEPTP